MRSSMKLFFFLLTSVIVIFVLLYPHIHPSSRTASPSITSTLPHTVVGYVALAKQDAQRAGIDATVFVHQITQESDWNPNAVSPAGAIGIAQFMPETAKALGVNPHDPVSSLQGAVKLMAALYHGYGNSYAKALAAYNAGAHSVNEAIANGGASWLDLLPLETQNYVKIILNGTGEA